MSSRERPRHAAIVVVTVAVGALVHVLGACVPAAPPQQGEGEGEGEGVDAGTTAPSFSFANADGAPLTALSLEHDAALGPLAVSLSIKNDDVVDMHILSEPPVLTVGPDAALWAVTRQPPLDVAAGTREGFDLQLSPPGGGTFHATLLLAYGVRESERLSLPIDVVVAGDVGPAPGVVASIYDGTFDVLPDFAALTPTEVVVTAGFDLGARAGTDLYAFAFDGNLEVAAAGTTSFTLTSDDGSQLFIDGALVVSNDGIHGPTPASGSVDLAAGGHAIRVTFFERDGGDSLVVEWQPPGGAVEAIPPTALSHLP